VHAFKLYEICIGENLRRELGILVSGENALKLPCLEILYI